jgi:hypothetical protein
MINLKSALVSAVLMALVGIITYILGVGNIFALDFHSLANIGAISFLTGVISFIKSSLTTPVGTFAGIQVK